MRRFIPPAAVTLAMLLASLCAEAQVPAAVSAAPRLDPLRVRLDAGGKEDDWSLVVNKGRPDLRLAKDGGTEVLEMRSSGASFGLQRKVAVDLSLRPFIAWRWRADVLPEGGDFRSLRTNDQAAQFYVAFSFKRAIGYIWDSNAPQGAVGINPSVPFMKVGIIVLRSGSGEAGSWALERRDLLADYELLFGEKPPVTRSLGLRLWINSQHTRSEAAGSFADLRFE
jgi:hypothetical protein